jgi:predicted nucleotidyltransferase
MIRSSGAPVARSALLDEILTSATRARLLTLLLTHPADEYYLRELARQTGQSLRAVQHELLRLERLGLVEARRHGRLKFFRANQRHPLFPDLTRIVYKTAGLGDVLRSALANFSGIVAAFVYGSVAKGDERAGSDVDVMVVGGVDPDELQQTVRKAERVIGREITVATMSPSEWRSRRAARDAFVMDLVRTNKIFLAGDERALRRLGTGGTH